MGPGQTWTGKHRTQRKVGEQRDVSGQGVLRCPPQLGTIDFYDENQVFKSSVGHPLGHGQMDPGNHFSSWTP